MDTSSDLNINYIELFKLCSINSSTYLNDNLIPIRDFTFRLLTDIYYRNVNHYLKSIETPIEIKNRLMSSIMFDNVMSYFANDFDRYPYFNLTINKVCITDVKGIASRKYGLLMDHEAHVPIEINDIYYEFLNIKIEKFVDYRTTQIAMETFPAEDEIRLARDYESHLNRIKNTVKRDILLGKLPTGYAYFYRIMSNDIFFYIFIKDIDIGNNKIERIYTYNGSELARSGPIESKSETEFKYYMQMFPDVRYMNVINFRTVISESIRLLEHYLYCILLDNEIKRIIESKKRMNYFVITNPITYPKLIHHTEKEFIDISNPPNLDQFHSTETIIALKNSKFGELYIGISNPNEIYTDVSRNIKHLAYIIEFGTVDVTKYPFFNDKISNSIKKNLEYYKVKSTVSNTIIAITNRYDLALNCIILEQKIVHQSKKKK